MAIRYQRALPSAQVRFKDRYTELITGAIAPIGLILLRESDSEGNIPVNRADDVVSRAGSIIQSVFVVDGRVSFREGVPVSAYARALMAEIAMVTIEVVSAHERYMKAVMPLDVQMMLAVRQSRTIGELADMRVGYEADDHHVRIIEQDEGLSPDDIARLRLFDPNPLSEYERAHTWVDPNGYVLSQRIWNTSIETRRKLDAFMYDMIQRGVGSQSMVRQLEQFLLPGRAKIRTRKPYGTDASYDAMRLARTEIARAHNQAAWVSAFLNPYVDKIRMRRSSSGQSDCPICPTYAGAVGGEGIVYSVYSVQVAPYHPHCMCYSVPEVADSPQAVTANLRSMLVDAERRHLQPFMTPLAASTFVDMLLSEAVAGILPQLLPMQRALF